MILIADNQAITRLGVTYLFAQEGKENLVAVNSKKELVAHLFTDPNSMVVVDYSQFNFGTVDELVNIAYRFPKTRWLLFSDELSTTVLRRLILFTEGFSVVLKDASAEEITAAIRSLIQGRKYVEKRLESILKQNKPEIEESESLTQTEIDILRWVALGLTNKEIAERRSASPHTVATHRKNIFRKLHLNTAQEATRYALKAGIVDMAEYVI